MSDSEAIQIIKGKNAAFRECSPEEVQRAWQQLVNSGHVWGMADQWWPNMATAMISAGTITRNAA